ncbi:SAF domain-containing protein [Brevibacterium sp. 2SA]|uniref:SAF domain-containing protein n=1 Tax=Brevibacterium sp. 2SA TaxID=2502198 RepID=UPI0010F5AFCE|nr:SAF domain-containing protein [Brevibacterium sp. 2SA]
MTTEAPPRPTEAPNPNPEVPARKAKKRVNLTYVAGAVVLIILGALGVYFVTNQFTNATQVVAVTDTLKRGDTIEGGDVTAFDIPEDQAGGFVSAESIQDLVGQKAVVDIPKGSLITPESIGANVTPPKGYTVVGLSLAPGQLPSTDLTAGDAVRIVDTPGAQGDLPEGKPLATTAQVLSTGTIDQSGKVLVDVLVSTDDAPQLAARASTETIALILDAPGEESGGSDDA